MSMRMFKQNAQRRIQASQQRGFTLIEVLVALVIVSLGIVSIIQVTSQHVNNISELEKRMLASWVASNHLAEIRHDAKVERLRSRSSTERYEICLLYTSPSPRDGLLSRMPSSA